MDGDAGAYLAQLNEAVQPIAAAVHKVLIGRGCSAYVKTIYIGYDLDGQMVAALYGHADHVEVALALSEDSEDELLVDATHLTWRTLPVAAILRSMDDRHTFELLASVACERVRTSQHKVVRDNDYFMQARRERRRQ